MLRIVMYGPDPAENHRLQELLADILWDAQIKPVFKEFTGEQEPFFAYVKNNPYLVMLVVQSGPAGMETVQLAKQANSAARLVWFSQQDYALYAFDLRLTFFGLLPVSRSKAASALRACWYEREFPPGISSLSQITLSPQQRISVMGNKETPSTGVIQA